MVNLILDTNIWIQFIAKNTPDGILERILKGVTDGEINLLSNEIILAEWIRNKETTIADITKTINDCYVSASIIEAVLPSNEKEQFISIISFFNKPDNISKAVLAQVNKTEDVLRRCVQMPVTPEMKVLATERGLNKKAPFIKNKNSVADAVIVLSAAEYCKNNTSGITDSIFVSFNHKDYSDEQNQDKIHPDLAELFTQSNMRFTKHIGHALHLVPEMMEEIGRYLDYMIDRYLDTDGDFERNR